MLQLRFDFVFFLRKAVLDDRTFLDESVIALPEASTTFVKTRKGATSDEPYGFFLFELTATTTTTKQPASFAAKSREG